MPYRRLAFGQIAQTRGTTGGNGMEWMEWNGMEWKGGMEWTRNGMDGLINWNGA